jgi:hypothetical protein
LSEFIFLFSSRNSDLRQNIYFLSIYENALKIQGLMGDAILTVLDWYERNMEFIDVSLFPITRRNGFAMDLEHTVNTLFKIWATATQAILQHPFHALCSENQCIYLSQFPLRQALPARGEWHVPAQFMEERLHLSHTKANRLGGLNKC